MSTYLVINIGIILFPLLLTFEKKIQYYKKLPAVSISMAAVGIPFIIWDAVAAVRGDWSFNPAYTSTSILAGLPPEEILFFITVPYSMLFLYETLKFYINEKTLAVKNLYIYSAAAFALSASLIVTGKYYTFTVLGFLIVLLFLSLTKLNLFRLKTYWLWIAFSYLPFALVNSLLTSLPVVQYSANAILGLRIFTIPVEDFLYSFVLLTFYLMVYIPVERRWAVKKK